MAEMKWNISPEDVAKSQLVKPGWHPTEISEVEIVQAKDKGSMNVRYTFKIFAGEYKGTENRFVYFNEKLPELMAPLIDALGYPKNAEGGYNFTINNNLVGKKFNAFWQRGVYEDKPINKVTEYAPLTEG